MEMWIACGSLRTKRIAYEYSRDFCDYKAERICQVTRALLFVLV